MPEQNTEAERTLLQSLEHSLDVNSSPVDDVIQLAVLYIDPFLREEDAMRLLELLLQRDPSNAAARVWLAYCCLYYLMDTGSLERGRVLLQPVISQGLAYVGAAYQLQAGIVHGLGSQTPDERIALLEASVFHEPGWVYNRYSLALAYRDVGRLEETADQLHRALANVVPEDSQWNSVRRTFEMTITGRTSHRIAEHLSSDLTRIGDIASTRRG